MRLFVGIELDDASRAACATVIDRLRAYGFEARYEAVEKLHITLAFLGHVAPEQVPAVRAAFQEVATASEPFVLTLDKLGAFPHERRPRVVYVGARSQGSAYRALAYGVRGTLRELGFEFEDDAVAHVTIARVKAHDRLRPLPTLDIESIPLAVDAIALFESLPADGSTRYEVRDRAGFSGEPHGSD